MKKSALDRPPVHKIETEVRDDKRIRIMKVYACCPGVIRALQSDINICYPPPPPAFSSPLKNEDLPGRATAGAYF